MRRGFIDRLDGIAGPRAVQRATTRLYERFGSGIVWVAMAGALALAILTAALWAVVSAAYWEMTTGQVILAVIATSAGAALAWIFGVVVSRGELREMRAWSGSPRDAAAATDAWIAVTSYPKRIVTRGSLFALVFLWVPGLPLATLELDAPWWAFVVAWIGGSAAPAAYWVVAVFSFELLFRPMLEDIARHLPADFEPPRRNWSLTAKALAPLPALTMFAVISVGAVASLSSDRETRGVATTAVAVLVVAIACFIYVVVTRAILAPIESLKIATERVRAGELDAAIPVVDADDLGALTASFNRMLTGLRDREALQSHNERLAMELRDSLARLAAASDAVRRQVERDLHDGAQQHLVLLKMKLAMLERDPGRTELLAEVRADLDAALAELRDLAHGIYPAVLESDGLPGALPDAAARASITTEVDIDGVGRYSPEIEAAVYFCCLEALQNAGKHAGAGASAAIRLIAAPGELRFEVSDTGEGFSTSPAASSSGLQNMADRIGALGGTLRVESTPGTGTTVAGSLPVGDTRP